jgi:hypothetical protein
LVSRTIDRGKNHYFKHASAIKLNLTCGNKKAAPTMRQLLICQFFDLRTGINDLRR